MKKMLTLLVALGAMSTLVAAPPAQAAPAKMAPKMAKKAAKKTAPKKMSGAMCPVCKSHKMVMKKDKMHPYAVKMNGKTYYSCCKKK